MIRYAFADGVVALKEFKGADPQKIGRALNKIRKANDGVLKPRVVWTASADPRHVLHRHFQWDDKVAAGRFRDQQARKLITSIVVVDDDDEEIAPAYFSIHSDDRTNYHAYQEVIASEDLQREVLRAAKRDADAFCNRYRELEDICVLVEKASKKVSRRLAKMEKERPQPQA